MLGLTTSCYHNTIKFSYKGHGLFSISATVVLQSATVAHRLVVPPQGLIVLSQVHHSVLYLRAFNLLVVFSFQILYKTGGCLVAFAHGYKELS